MASTFKAPKYVHRFDSFTAFVDYANGPTDMPLNERSSHRNYGSSWDECSTFEEAIELAYRGWSQVRNDVQAVTATVLPALRDALPEQHVVQHDVTGACVDMGAFLSGVPECMLSFVPEPVDSKGKVVTILASISCSGMVQADDIRARGAAICALVECMALLDHQVEIWCEAHCGEITHVVRVKGAGDPLDLDTVMFALAHPAMFRRLAFAAEEREPAAIRRANGVGSGYGGKGHEWGFLTQSEALGADILLPSDSYMGYTDPEDRFSKADRANPSGWVQRQLRKRGLLPE